MLDLQVIDPTSNKENFPPTPNPQRKRLTLQLNQMPSITRRGMWTNEALKVARDVVKRGAHSLRRASKLWNIPMNSLFYYMNGKTKSKKMGLSGLLRKKEGALVIAWTLAMQECGLSISLQQL
jgi:hypothetical protein